MRARMRSLPACKTPSVPPVTGFVLPQPDEVASISIKTHKPNFHFTAKTPVVLWPILLTIWFSR